MDASEQLTVYLGQLLTAPQVLLRYSICYHNPPTFSAGVCLPY